MDQVSKHGRYTITFSQTTLCVIPLRSKHTRQAGFRKKPSSRNKTPPHPPTLTKNPDREGKGGGDSKQDQDLTNKKLPRN